MSSRLPFKIGKLAIKTCLMPQRGNWHRRAGFNPLSNTIFIGKLNEFYHTIDAQFEMNVFMVGFYGCWTM
jgi:hypothetical protein